MTGFGERVIFKTASRETTVNAVDKVLLYAVETLALGFVALSLYKGVFRRYLYLNLFTICMVAADLARTLALRSYSIKSTEYFFIYYGTDFCLVMLRYTVIISFFETILRDSPLRTQARMAFLFFFGIVSAMSYGFISNQVISNITIFYKKLLVEFQQNMYFAGVVMLAMLCITLAHLRIKDAQIRMLIAGLGVSGAFQACGWAMQNLVPKALFHNWWGFTRLISPIATVVMLSLWCYAVTRVPAMDSVASPEDDSQGVIDTPAHEHAMMFAPVTARVEARS